MKLRALFFFAVVGLFIALPNVSAAAGTSTTALPRCSMSATPSTVIKGGSFTLKWSSTNATSAYIPGPGLGSVKPNDQRNLIPVRSTKLTGTFTGPGGKAVCEAIIVVLNSNGSPMPVVSYDDPQYGEPFVFLDGSASSGGTATAPGSASSGGTAPAPGSATGGGTFSGPQSSGGSSNPFSGAPSGNSGNVQTDTPSSGASSQLVPCDGINCQACNLVQLSQRIINFLLGLSIPLAAAMFAYAGVLYFTSSVSNQIEKAKKVFKAVFIGFIIVVGAWLAIQTLMSAILDDSYKNWNQISCQSGRRTSESINTLLNSIGVLTSNLNTTPQDPNNAQSWQGGVSVGQSSVYGCSSGAYNPDDNNCYGSDGSVTPAKLSGSGVGFNQYNGSIAASIDGYNGANTSAGPNCEGNGGSGGQCACAWAVNNVLTGAGIPTIDGDSVAGMRAELDGGRGALIDPTDGQKGDIVVWKEGSVSHVGFCYNDGCSQTISNSSSGASFNRVSGLVDRGVTGKVYRLK